MIISSDDDQLRELNWMASRLPQCACNIAVTRQFLETYDSLSLRTSISTTDFMKAIALSNDEYYTMPDLVSIAIYYIAFHVIILTLHGFDKTMLIIEFEQHVISHVEHSVYIHRQATLMKKNQFLPFVDTSTYHQYPAAAYCISCPKPYKLITNGLSEVAVNGPQRHVNCSHTSKVVLYVNKGHYLAFKPT